MTQEIRDGFDPSKFAGVYDFFNAKSAQAVAMTCVDHRFRRRTNWFLKYTLGFRDVDMKTDAGGVFQLNHGHVDVKEWLLRNFQLCREHHEAGRLILINHFDCAAYGGSKAFDNKGAELIHHQNELQQAAALIRQELGEFEIVAYIAIPFSQGDESKVGYLQVNVDVIAADSSAAAKA